MFGVWALSFLLYSVERFLSFQVKIRKPYNWFFKENFISNRQYGHKEVMLVKT
jgi:hypothetical protein